LRQDPPSPPARRSILLMVLGQIGGRSPLVYDSGASPLARGYMHFAYTGAPSRVRSKGLDPGQRSLRWQDGGTLRSTAPHRSACSSGRSMSATRYRACPFEIRLRAARRRWAAIARVRLVASWCPDGRAFVSVRDPHLVDRSVIAF